MDTNNGKYFDYASRIAGWRHLIIALILLSAVLKAIDLMRSFFPTPFEATQYLDVLICFLTLLYLILYYTGNYCTFLGNKGRLSGLLANAFGKTLIGESEGRYDNSCISPGVPRLFMNSYQNCFYTYHTSCYMLKKRWPVPLVIMLAILICAIFSLSDVLVFILQIAVILQILVSYIRLFDFCNQLEKCLQGFTDNVNARSCDKEQALVYVLRYEHILAHYTIGLDSAIFCKIKDELDEKWINIVKQAKKHFD